MYVWLLVCRHGDLLYLAEKKPATSSTKDVAMVTGLVQEDAVDCALALKDGKIQRKRDPIL